MRLDISIYKAKREDVMKPKNSPINISCDPSSPRWCYKLSLDSEGNIRNFDGSIVGKYDMSSIKEEDY